MVGAAWAVILYSFHALIGIRVRKDVNIHLRFLKFSTRADWPPAAKLHSFVLKVYEVIVVLPIEYNSGSPD
jgi:hypothetical protein